MKKIIKSIVTFFTEHWVLKLFLLSIPSMWSITLTFFPVPSFLADADGHPNIFGIIIFGFLLGITLIISALSELQSQKEYLIKNRENLRMFLESSINNSTSKICENKRLTLAKYAKLKTMNTKRLNSPFGFMVPKKQMAYIAEEIAFLIKDLTNLDSSDVMVSIAYTFVGNFKEEWAWIESRDLSGCATLKELFTHQNSTFYYIKDKANYFVFYNSKKQAERENNYYFDSRDIQEQNEGHDGSVICKNIEASYNDEVFAKAVLSVSSFRKQFVLSNKDKDISIFRDNVKIVLDNYTKRIQIELLNLYIKRIETNSDDD